MSAYWCVPRGFIPAQSQAWLPKGEGSSERDLKLLLFLFLFHCRGLMFQRCVVHRLPLQLDR